MSIEIKTETKWHLVFTHNDDDGLFSAFAVKHAYDNNMVNSEWPRNVECIICDYDDQYNLEWFKSKVDEYVKKVEEIGSSVKDIIVYMLDYAIQPNEDMLKFFNYVTKVVGAEFYWIDHHSSSIENLAHWKIPGVQDTTKSGSSNSWDFFKELGSIDNVDMPLIYKVINDFDMNNTDDEKIDWENLVLPIHTFISSLDHDLNDNESDLVKYLYDAITNGSQMNRSIDIGKALCNIQKKKETNFSKNAYEENWMDYKCLVLNIPNGRRDMFNECEKINDVDLLITWNYVNGEYKYNVYAVKDNIDVGSLCEKFLNGGGHKEAGGGSSTEYIFSKSV